MSAFHLSFISPVGQQHFSLCNNLNKCERVCALPTDARSENSVAAPMCLKYLQEKCFLHHPCI